MARKRYFHLKNAIEKIVVLFVICHVYRSTAQDLNFTMTKESGTFHTPNFPAKYPSNIECIWLIKVQPGRFILLSFDVFEVESFHGNCIDIVEVKDGSSSSSQLLGGYCNSTRPPKVITSSGNSLRIWFFTDSTVQYMGFKASYTSQKEKGCGGFLTESSGSISSPRYPDYPYPNSMQCEWTITVSRGMFIRLEFSSLEVEYFCGRKCHCKDKLDLLDGSRGNETKMARFCKSFKRIVVSKSNRMRLLFTTNKEGRFKGFRLSYATSVTPECGGDINGTSGQFVSPNYPMPFPAFSDCTWRIQVPDDQYISLTFEEFIGFNGSNPECTADSIELREGYTKNAPVIERFCDQNLPPVIVSSGHQLYIHFRSRSPARATPRVYGKFKGVFLAHSRGCNESIGLQDRRVKNSQLSASSYLTLQLSQGKLYFLPQYGRLGNPHSWCSQAQAFKTIIGEYLQIDLLNLTEITGVATQGYELNGISHMGFVTRYKIDYSYEENRWITVMGNDKNSTKLGYKDFIGNKDANGEKKNVFNPTIIARMIRIFPTGYKSYPVRHACLRAELYGCAYKAGCGTMFSVDKPGKISVRGLKLFRRQCSWLSIPSHSRFTNNVTFFHFTNFDVPCHLGHVILSVRDGGKMTKLCGQDPPPVTILPAQSQILVKIDLAAGKDMAGFDLSYYTEPLGCGGIMMQVTKGTLTSPNYPESYENKEHCTWILSTKPGSNIRLRFVELNLAMPNETECSDYVEMRDGRVGTSTLLGRMCGDKITDHVISTFNHMRVTFHSDEATRGKGFLLEYDVISPPEGEDTKITSPQSAETEGTDVTIVTRGPIIRQSESAASPNRVSFFALLFSLLIYHSVLRLFSENRNSTL